MKKLILVTALITISLPAKLYAQTDGQSTYLKELNKSKTARTFNIYDGLVTIRDIVTLKEGKMILEMTRIDDYNDFRNLDPILGCFLRDIAFYKDSLEANATGNTRIDYVINPDQSFRKIRFKKYGSDGEVFMNQQGEVSRLKMEQDTVRIIVQKSMPGLGRHNGNTPACTIPYSIQVTFLVDNYADVGKIISDHVLGGIVDTLEKVTIPKKPKKVNEPAYYYLINRVSIIYNPYYNGPGNLLRLDYLVKSENDISAVRNKSKRFLSLNANVGSGLVRNTLAPMADIGIQYNRYWGASHIDHNILRVSVTPYCFFDKNDAGNYVMNDNWFVNAAIGSIYEHSDLGWFGKECTFGVGYLFAEKGGYFKNTTFKMFTDLQVSRWITSVPEFIFTDNFKQIFPGFTVKVF